MGQRWVEDATDIGEMETKMFLRRAKTMKTTQMSRHSRYVLSVRSFLLSSFTPHSTGLSQILEEPSSISKAR